MKKHPVTLSHHEAMAISGMLRVYSDLLDCREIPKGEMREVTDLVQAEIEQARLLSNLLFEKLEA